MQNESLNIISLNKKDYHDKNKIIKTSGNSDNNNSNNNNNSSSSSGGGNEESTINVYWKDSDIEKLKKEIQQLQDEEKSLNDSLSPYRAQMKQLEEDAKRNLDKVHQYNEIKDSCQAIIGKLAELEGLTIAQMNKVIGIEEKDDIKK